MAKDEEKGAHVTVCEAEAEPTSTASAKANLPSRFLHHIPIAAFLELFIALLVVIAGAILVACINNKVQWGDNAGQIAGYNVPSISPQTILSLVHSASAFLIALALKDGITIAWWRRAMVGSTIKDLDHRYQAGSSLKAAVLAGKSFGWIALATIAAAAFGFTQGPLMQSALNVRQSTQDSNITLTTNLAMDLPNGFTGLMTELPSYTAQYLTPDFNTIVKAFKAGVPIKPPTFSGCQGTCHAVIPGFGLAMDCTTTTTPVNISLTARCPNGPNGNCHGLNPNGELFQSSFNYEVPDWTKDGSLATSYINMGLSFVDTGSPVNKNSYDKSTGIMDYFGCYGQNHTHVCQMKPAIIEYPVIIQNNSVQSDLVTLDPEASPIYRIVRLTNITDDPSDFAVTLGGIPYALNQLYASELSIFPHGMGFAEATNTGTLAMDSAVFNASASSTPSFLQSCAVSFDDPSSMLLAAVNEVMFRTAIQVAMNETFSHAITTTATQSTPVNRYTADYYYLGASLGVTILFIALILPTFWGYWELERKVSLNPIELAEAFNAPVLRKEVEHKDLNDLMESVGDRQVMYAPVPVHLRGADGDMTITRRAMVIPGEEDLTTVMTTSSSHNV